jgi:transcriptional regulator with XRE-family HTH domain
LAHDHYTRGALVTKRIDPARDDAGVRLRTLRLRRGMSQVAVADLARISPAFVSMIETGQRSLTRARDILALADVLRVSPLYLADGREDDPAPGRPGPTTVPFPARCDPLTLARHQQLARQFIHLAPADTRAAGDWLRRLAREPAVSPWLLLDQLAALHAARPPAAIETP